MTTENQAPEGGDMPKPHGMKWRNKQTGATGVYFEDPGQFGINTDHPDYEWTPIYTADQLRAALAAQPQAPAWQPIETAPRDGSMFLCWVAAERWSHEDGGGSGRSHDVSQVDFCWWRDGVDGNGYFDPACGQIGDAQDVTHWMPLPAAPQTKEQP